MREFLQEEILDICTKSIIFKDIKKEDIKSFLSLLNYKIYHVKKGDLVFSEGDYIDYMAIILEGEIIACKYCINGSESIMSRLKSNQVVGLDILATPIKNSFYNAYATRSTYLLKINKDIIDNDRLLVQENRIIILKNIIHCLANESAKKCHKIEIISQKSTRSKIMNYLLVQEKNHNCNKFKISFDRDQLASYLCINRSVLSHELSLMQQEGIIRFKKNDFEILK